MLPDLPDSLQGLTIAHLTDLHIRRRRGRFDRLVRILRSLTPDLYFLTGDYMTYPGDEAVSLEVMREVTAALTPRIGSFGVFGNHDSAALVRAIGELPVRWMADDAVALPDWPVDILGFHASKKQRPNGVAALANLMDAHESAGIEQALDADSGADRRVRLLLCHYPTFLPVAADMQMDVMFSGHTHGGQFRFPRKLAVYNSCDLPLHLTAGLLRHQDTLCCLSRGLGETFVALRAFCPPQLPIYTLRRGPLPGVRTSGIENVTPW